jgi:mRNA-degrading endonuclease toxin of MazEF toxin-antitoxin module
MTNFPQNGDIVLVDLGMVAKVRPCLVLCGNPDSERTVSIVAPLTSEVRGGESEISFPKPPWLAKPCVVNLSGVGSVERHRIQRRLGQFPPQRFEGAKKVIARMFI